MTSKDSLAAQNRFIYYPDHLVRMPGPGSTIMGNLFNIWSEPVFKGSISGILTEVLKLKRPDDLHDESIGSFLSRRFGSALTDNIASAVFHGVYAGDIYKLSARSILAQPWQWEARHGSVIEGGLASAIGLDQPITTDDLEIVKHYQKQPPMSDPLESAKKSSVFTFRGGIGELADRLETKLLETPNVNIKRKTLANKLALRTDTAAPKVRRHLYNYPG